MDEYSPQQTTKANPVEAEGWGDSDFQSSPIIIVKMFSFQQKLIKPTKK